MATVKKKPTTAKATAVKKFHGFASPKDAILYYYKHELHGRHPEGFEFRQELALLNWLEARDLAKSDFPAVSGRGQNRLKPRAETLRRGRGR